MFHFFKRQLSRLGFHIRKISTPEIVELKRLATDTFYETYPEYISKINDQQIIQQEVDSLYSDDVLLDWISASNNVCLGLFKSAEPDRLVGFSLLQINGHQALISKIYLLKCEQGKGIGRMLLEANFAELRKTKTVKQLKLEVWDKNSKAKLFYEKMGFSPTGIKKVYSVLNDDEFFWDEEYIKPRNNFF